MDPTTYLNHLAGQLARDLTENEAISKFTDNSDLIGAFAEASVRCLVARMVSPLRVSRGAILYEENCPSGAKQIDSIIWSPCPIPALFERGDFAIVPRGSAHAFLEIKRTNYTNVGQQIAATLSLENSLIVPHLGKAFPCSLGVVCLHEHARKDPKLQQLVVDGRAVILLKRVNDDLVASAEDVWRLVNFLAGVRLRAVMLEGKSRVKWPPTPVNRV